MKTGYDSVKEASEAENIPIEIIKEAKKKLPECFKFRRITDWPTLRKYIDTYYEELEEEAYESIDALKKERLRKQIDRDDFEFAIQRSKYLESEVVKQRIKDIAQAQRIILKTALLDELPPSIVGLSQADILLKCEEVFNKVCKEMNSIKL